jgi:hypothetical protein
MAAGTMLPRHTTGDENGAQLQTTKTFKRNKPCKQCVEIQIRDLKDSIGLVRAVPSLFLNTLTSMGS